jgi:NAD(P)-dependent dehydrogenase (short-subunit alcohol dehydrogenase family)
MRVVLLGGTCGIGLAVARAVTQAGGTAVVASRDPASVAQAVESLGGETRGHRLDCTDEDAVRGFFDEAGDFDHLVYTAGAPPLYKPFARLSVAEARGTFEVRYWGAFAAVKHGAGGIRPGGSIVLTSGVIAVRPAPTLTGPISASGAIEALARALAVELAPIRVNAVRLGPVGSRMIRLNGHDPEPIYRRMREILPIGRMGEPHEAAAGYLHLMQNGFATGTVFTLDGGYVLV